MPASDRICLHQLGNDEEAVANGQRTPESLHDKAGGYTFAACISVSVQCAESTPINIYFCVDRMQVLVWFGHQRGPAALVAPLDSPSCRFLNTEDLIILLQACLLLVIRRGRRISLRFKFRTDTNPSLAVILSQHSYLCP